MSEGIHYLVSPRSSSWPLAPKLVFEVYIVFLFYFVRTQFRMVILLGALLAAQSGRRPVGCVSTVKDKRRKIKGVERNAGGSMGD